MQRTGVLLLLAASAVLAREPNEGRAAAIAAQLKSQGLDPKECYRVRDLTLARDEIRLYLTDGYLVLAKPVEGRRVAAVFVAGEEGDAEILLMPPVRSERLSLANFNDGVPNFSRHFTDALLLFTDNTEAEITDAIAKSGAKRSEETGALLASNWNGATSNILASFSVRLAEDLIGNRRDLGFFFGALAIRNIGSLDVMFDPRAPQQITLGRLASRNDLLFYDVWCHFQARSWRTGRRSPAGPDFKLSNYRLDTNIDANLHVGVTTRVTVTPAAPLGSLSLEISPQMHVMEARVDGQPAEVFARESLRANLLHGGDNEGFLVVPPQPLDAGRDYELEIRHEGNVVAEAGNNVYYVGSRGNWYPNRDLQFAVYNLTFRYPRLLTLVSTGGLLDETVEGETRIARYRTPGPVRLAGFNLGYYQKFTARDGGVAVDVYANREVESALAAHPRDIVVLPPQFPRRQTEVVRLPPAPAPDPTAQSQALANEVASECAFFTSRFGPPPLTQLTVSPIPGRFGQGFPGLIYLSTLAYLRPQDRPNAANRNTQLFFSELLHAHEVAHQWWGNVVTTSGYQDGWIMEGLANYSALMYLEKKKGTRALEELLEGYKMDLLAKLPDGNTVESRGPITWGLRLESSQSPMAWQVITYDKGAWIFHMIRRMLGDKAFQDMLATLAQRYKFQSIPVPELQALIASFLPKDFPDPKLDTFFENWIYDVGIPALKLSYSVKGKAPNIVVTGSVSQTGVSDRFTAYAPVEITTARGRIVKWVATGDASGFTVKLPAPPVRVTLDPQGSVLAVRK